MINNGNNAGRSLQQAESSIQSKIVDKLKKLNYIVIKTTVSSLNGWPDLTIFRNGYTFFIEVKALNKEPSPLQLHRHSQLRSQNFIVLVIDSNDGISSLLNSLDNGRKDLPTLY